MFVIVVIDLPRAKMIESREMSVMNKRWDLLSATSLRALMFTLHHEQMFQAGIHVNGGRGGAKKISILNSMIPTKSLLEDIRENQLR